MILPDMRYADGIRKQKQLQFGGLNHNVGAEDGELWDMENLCSDDYPVLSVRKKRLLYRKLEKPNGIFAWKGLMWVDGTDLYYDGMLVGEVEDSKKTFGAVGPYVVILPDKLCYDVEADDLTAMEASWTQGGEEVFLSADGGSVEILAGGCEICIVARSKSFLNNTGANDYLRVGDAVTLYGMADSSGNLISGGYSAIIRQINTSRGQDEDGTYWAKCVFVFYEDTFAYMSIDDSIAFSIKRSVPDLQYLCEDGNRLWGCDKTSVYACKLGDPFNWNVFDGVATDSWAVTPGSSGEFTGCCNFQGYPTFFKEDRIYKAYGSVPSDFSLVDSPYMGVMEGCGKTLCDVGGVLFYLSSAGPVAYTGSVPQPINKPFGDMRFIGGVAGRDTMKYYACLEDADGQKRLYVYDTQKGLWHIEDRLDAVGLCRYDGKLHCLDAQGQICLLGDCGAAGEGTTEEDVVPWMAEFGDFTHEDPNHKGLTKLQLRLQMEEGSEVKILVQYDSDGPWRLVRAVTGESSKRNYYLPIIPRRCDHYRLRLEGVGRCRLYSLVRESYSGSERNAK